MHIRHLAVIRKKTKKAPAHTHTKIHIQYNNDQQDSTGVSAGQGQHRGMKGRNNEADFFSGRNRRRSDGMEWTIWQKDRNERGKKKKKR